MNKIEVEVARIPWDTGDRAEEIRHTFGAFIDVRQRWWERLLRRPVRQELAHFVYEATVLGQGVTTIHSDGRRIRFYHRANPSRAMIYRSSLRPALMEERGSQ